LFAPSAFGLAALLSGGKSPGEFTATYNAVGSASKRAGAYYGQSCERSNDSSLCMMCNCMRESSGEPLEGKVMVGLVVKSRVQAKKWADDICGVIYEPWQFSWTMEDRGTRALPNTMTKDFNECMIATDRTINAAGNGVDHYHANYVKPKWAKNC